ncbi:hypothetical protein [Nocardioides sp. SYSU D00038]|uniref:hypothetical protein n=1 Tax=Nocardioides sp. SYSU D00038 TaxID=2812554 RepID=UPI001967CCF3|nr:hypothetical protein [Nocardioides sp. SYSU D00038]
MPTSRADRRRSRRSRRALPALAVVLALAAGPALTGCGLFGDDDQPSEDPATTYDVPNDVVADLQEALRLRQQALLEGDRRAFRATLVRGRPEFRRQQDVYFDNLQQLPLAAFSYALRPEELLRRGDDYWVVVDQTLQLAGYDEEPVRSPDRFLFRPAGRSGHYLLASVTDAEWEAENGVHGEPWDEGPIRVRTGSGVLGIFDDDSVRAADRLVRSVERGIADVSGWVPYTWSRSVVVYALSTSDYLDTIDDLPGGDPELLDGVAFPVKSRPDGDALAATRFALHPRMLDKPGLGRDRLIRHELTHVALGTRDDDVPIWLSEGLAEFVSVRPLAPEQRLIPARAVTAARDGFTDMPDDDGFNDADSAANYGLAWWACEYLAASYGEQNLWALLDELNRDGVEVGAALQDLVGLNTRQLARKAGKLLLVTFDPDALEPDPPPAPSANATPTDGATPPTPGVPGSTDPSALPPEEPVAP